MTMVRLMSGPGTDVAVYVRCSGRGPAPAPAQWFRLALQGTTLRLELNVDGFDEGTWLVALQAECGEATPIVSRVLQSLKLPAGLQVHPW